MIEALSNQFNGQVITTEMVKIEQEQNGHKVTIETDQINPNDPVFLNIQEFAQDNGLNLKVYFVDATFPSNDGEETLPNTMMSMGMPNPNDVTVSMAPNHDRVWTVRGFYNI